MQKKFKRHHNKNLKSTIVQKDEETLIVSQHIPSNDDSVAGKQSQHLTINYSYDVRDTHVKQQVDEEIMVS